MIDKEFVRASCQGGIGQGEQPIPLPDIYVDLDVVVPAQEKSQDQHWWALQLVHGRGKERTALLDALSQGATARAVLLGDAGTGKTTFVNYLAYLLAADPDRLPTLFRGLLLVRLVLREVAARHLPTTATQGTAEMLWNALADDIAAHLGQPAAAVLFSYLQRRLLAEGGFILLDGLDEVPEARQRRQVLLQAIARLTAGLPKGSTRCPGDRATVRLRRSAMASGWVCDAGSGTFFRGAGRSLHRALVRGRAAGHGLEPGHGGRQGYPVAYCPARTALPGRLGFAAAAFDPDGDAAFQLGPIAGGPRRAVRGNGEAVVRPVAARPRGPSA